MQKCVWILCGCLWSLACGGCGGPERPKYPVSHVLGTVTLDNQPLEKGRVQFAPVAPTPGITVSGEVIGGKFDLVDVPIGKHKVIFNASKETGKMISDRAEPYPEVVNLIPVEYRDGLDATVSGSETKPTFELKSK